MPNCAYIPFGRFLAKALRVTKISIRSPLLTLSVAIQGQNEHILTEGIFLFFYFIY